MISADETNSKYGRLYAILYGKIASGEWKSGYRLLPERELCLEYDVSRITVRQTLQLLEEQGLIVRKQGRGTFVQFRPVEQKLTKLYTLREHLDQTGINSKAELLEYNIFTADLFMAEKLQILPGEKVVRIQRRFLANDMPYNLETTYLPHKYFNNITEAAVRDNGLYNTFSALGVVIKRAVEQLKPVRPDKTSAQLLGVTMSDVAMSISRTTYSYHHVIEYTECIVRGDFFIYTVELS